MRKRHLVLLLTVAILAIALSACGSSSSGGSTSAGSDGSTVEAPAPSEPTTSGSEGGAAESPASSAAEEAEIDAIIKLKINGRYGSRTRFEVAGGSCKVDKINTSAAALKQDGEAVFDAEHNASVLVSPIKGKNGTPTEKECQEGISAAID